MRPVVIVEVEPGLEGLISKLPGVKGYREKEMRRDADKQMRDALALQLSDRRTKITAMQNDLLATGGLLWMDDLERLVGRLQLLIDRVKTAAYDLSYALTLARGEALKRWIDNCPNALYAALCWLPRESRPRPCPPCTVFGIRSCPCFNPTGSACTI